MKFNSLFITTAIVLAGCMPHETQKPDTSPPTTVIAPIQTSKLNEKEAKGVNKLDALAKLMKQNGTQQSFNVINGSVAGAGEESDKSTTADLTYLQGATDGNLLCIEDSKYVANASDRMVIGKTAPEPYGRTVINALRKSDGFAVVKSGTHTIIGYSALRLAGKKLSDQGKKFYCAVIVLN